VPVAVRGLQCGPCDPPTPSPTLVDASSSTPTCPHPLRMLAVVDPVKLAHTLFGLGFGLQFDLDAGKALVPGPYVAGCGRCH
jgi:hypothetical protein